MYLTPALQILAVAALVASVAMALLRKVGIDLDKVGNSTGQVPGL